jgi:hypothetical protein
MSSVGPSESRARECLGWSEIRSST